MWGKIRRIIGLVAVIVGGGALIYFSWAANRLGFHAITEPGWPRPWPYPDGWLLELNNYYDALYPGGIKLHSEFPRVLRNVNQARVAGALIFLTGAALLWRPLNLRGRRGQTGFEVTRGHDSDV